MAYCRNCGAEINENAYICIHCGAKVGSDRNEEYHPNGVTLGIIGLCLFWFPLATWILSGIGMGQAVRTNNSTGKTLNLIGLILTSVLFLIFFIVEFAYGGYYF